jgi:hypothetical protein
MQGLLRPAEASLGCVLASFQSLQLPTTHSVCLKVLNEL